MNILFFPRFSFIVQLAHRSGKAFRPTCNICAARAIFLLLTHRPVSSANWDLELKQCFGFRMSLMKTRNCNGLRSEPCKHLLSGRFWMIRNHQHLLG